MITQPVPETSSSSRISREATIYSIQATQPNIPLQQIAALHPGGGYIMEVSDESKNKDFAIFWELFWILLSSSVIVLLLFLSAYFNGIFEFDGSNQGSGSQNIT